MKEFFLHLGAQLATAAVTYAASADYSSLGKYGPLAQVGATMIVAGYNNFFSQRAKT